MLQKTELMEFWTASASETFPKPLGVPWSEKLKTRCPKSVQ